MKEGVFDMDLIIIILSITIAQIPAVILRYLPFSQLITMAQKKKLFLYYSLSFIVQHIILYLLLVDKYNILTPFWYKIIILCATMSYVLINLTIIKGFFFQHMFTLGMQGIYSLILHSIIAMILSFYSEHLTIPVQFIIQTYAYIILFILITYPLWKYLKNSLLFKNHATKDYYWNIVWVLPPLLFFSDIVITMSQQWIHTWQQFISRILTGFAMLIIWKCINLDFKSLEEIFILKNINNLLFIQKESIQSKAKIMKENDNKMRILKHDMRHHLQLLSSLIENNNFTEANHLISQLTDNLQSTKPIVFCKNAVINSALLVYITKAQENNIEIISEIDIPKSIPWNSNDIAILFTNVLENAVIASMKQLQENREIHITTRYDDQKLAINIKNKFDGEVLFGENGLPISKEPDHGIGINSMLSIIKKYHAHFSCSHKDGWYSISFLFSENFIKKNDVLY